MKNLISFVAVLSLGLSATGCGSPGEAFVKDVCACKDSECTKKAFDAHAEKYPPSKATFGEMDKLSAEDKKYMGEATTCLVAVAKGEKK